MTINLTSVDCFTTALLIGDAIAVTGGSDDATPSLTTVGGVPVSAALEVQSVLGAFLLPRMTTTQMNALLATNGMLIYNTTANSLYAYVNGAWAAK